jgi:hypothetical protein
LRLSLPLLLIACQALSDRSPPGHALQLTLRLRHPVQPSAAALTLPRLQLLRLPVRLTVSSEAGLIQG